MNNIPGFQTLMLPILKIISDGREHALREIIDILANDYKLTDKERKELLLSGVQPIFDNRVGWAKTYLKKAGLLIYPKRGYIQITDRGKKVLEEKPKVINIDYLRHFDGFNEFRNISKQDESNASQQVRAPEEVRTPEEVIESVYQSIKRTLADELLDKVQKVEPQFLEKLVVELLLKMGYGGSMEGAGQIVGKPGDEGIDGIIKEDKLGLDIVYIQAKRWGDKNVVGRQEIQKFVGALTGQGAKKGIFITTSSFTEEALKYIESIKSNGTMIVWIDGEQLANLMIEYNVGVYTQQAYEIKKLNNDYFENE